MQKKKDKNKMRYTCTKKDENKMKHVKTKV